MARSSPSGTLAYRTLTPPWEAALELFRFAGAWAPPPTDVFAGWGAWDGERLLGALVMERAGTTAMLHGPVVVAPVGMPPEEVLAVASELTAQALAHAGSVGVDTIFARPQSLDRVWVRAGFIPLPEAELPRFPALGGMFAGAVAQQGGMSLMAMLRSAKTSGVITVEDLEPVLRLLVSCLVYYVLSGLFAPDELHPPPHNEVAAQIHLIVRGISR